MMYAAPVPPIIATAGSSFSVDFDGFTGSSHTVVDGLLSTINFSGFTFTDVPSGATQVSFQIEVVNTSTSPLTASRVSGVGFDTTPTILEGAPNSVSGIFDNVTVDGNMPNGIGSVEFCFSDVNCAGGGSGGVTMGGTGIAYATIYLSGTGQTSLTFDDLFVRYQSISGAGSVTSASGSPIDSPVPEPGAYAVLMLGLLVVNYRVNGNLSAGLRRLACCVVSRQSIR